MFTSKLRTVGGSVMFAIPKPMLDGLGLQANQEVGVSIIEGKIVVEPKVKLHYTLTELLAQCDLDQPVTDEEREWLHAPATGDEGM